MKTSFGYRVVSFLSSFSLLIQTLTPFFSVPMTVRAQESLNSDISYSISNKVFKFSVNNKDAGITTGQLQYQLSYKNDSSGNPDQIEVAQGTADISDSNFEKTIDAATCSTNGTCRVHEAPRGILKIKLPNWTDIKWFSISGETVTVVNEKFDGVMDSITDDERNWLLKGDAPAPTATPVPPTPTAEPTVAPTEVPVTAAPTVEPTVSVVPTGSTLGTATGDEVVQATIVDSQAYVNPSIWTNQADYAPTQTVYVSGKNFTPGIYTVVISSNDPPAVTATGSVTVGSDGTFTYSYQLDGRYRPNYLVQVSDASGVVAETSFTDGNNTLGQSCTTDSDCKNPLICTNGTCQSASSGSASYALTAVQNMQCMADLPNAPSSLTCTANDIQLASVSNINIVQKSNDGVNWTTASGQNCDFPGQYIKFTASWSLQSTATHRYNVGLWFANQGQTSALHGYCSATTLPSQPLPFFEDTNDTCGDINSGSVGTISPAITVVAQCKAAPGTNQMALPYCTSWDQQEQSGNACHDPSGTVPGASSKCNCNDSNTVPITVPPAIEVVKNLVPSNDPGLFNLQVNAVTKKTDATNGGSTGKVVVSTGTNSIGEHAGTGTDLGNYSSAVSCVLRGTSTVVSTSGSNPWTLNVTNGQDILCTITNTRKQATLTVNKILVPSTDAGKFDLRIDGTIAGSGGNVGNGGTTGPVILNPGTHTVSETAVIGTDLSRYTSVISGDCAANGSITLASNDNKTCTITNTLNTGTINIVKTAVGGNDTFGFTVTGPNSYNSTQSISTSGGGATGSITVTAGVGYSVTENTLPVGWASTSVSCTNGTTSVTNTNFEVTSGGAVTCTFTNSKQPRLTVSKVCDPANDTGKFNLNIDGTTRKTDALCGQSTDPVTLTVGAHTVSEAQGTGTNLGNYASIIGGDCGRDGSITLAAGDVKACTITNTLKRGSITVKKVMIGGTGSFDFTGDVAGTISVNNGILTTSNLLPGTYSAVEGTTAGWDLTGITCDDTGNGGTVSTGNLAAKTAIYNVEAGENVTCTFTNTKKGHLIVQKTTIPAGDPAEFTINASSSNGGVITGGGAGTVTDATDMDYEVIPGIYSVTETVPTEWDKTGDTCQNVQVGAGETKYCELTNVKQGTVIVRKQATGGDATFNYTASTTDGANLPTSFSITTTAGAGEQTYNNIKPGTYTISEVGLIPGWTQTSVTCNGQNSNSFTLAAGATVTCVFSNLGQGKIVINKTTIGADGTFNYAVTGVSASTPSITTTGRSGSTGNIVVTAGSGYSVTEQDPGPGWIAGSMSCVNGASQSVNSVNFGVSPGDTITCSLTNTKKATIVIKKNTAGGDDTFHFTTTGGLGAGSFDLTTVSGSASQTFDNVVSGTYGVSEGTLPDGWVLSSATCDNSNNPSSITINPGTTVTCTFTNTKQPRLTLVKNLVKDNGGTANATDWTLSATGSTNISGKTGVASVTDVAVNAGTYTLAESTGPAGYTASQYSCVKNNGTPVISNTVTLAAGDIAVCTITNNDIAPSLTLYKTVTNDNGGSAVPSAWTLTATGTLTDATNLSGTSGVTSGSNFKADTYTLGETGGPNGYTTGNWVCTGGSQSGNQVTVGLGQTVSCTINNNDNVPSLTLNKILTLSHGGTATIDDWTLSATGPATLTGHSGVKSGTDFKAGTYTLSESGPTKGYGTDGWVCDGGIMSTDKTQVTVGLGETVTCTVTNHDEQGILIVKKVVVDQYDEIPPAASSFTIHVSGTGMLVNDKTNQTEADILGSTSGVEIPIDGGAFNVNEATVAGYTTTYTGDCIGTIHVGDIYTCTVTNTKQAPPVLTLSKFNTTWPNDTSAGNNVEYHLKVNVADNTMNGIVVTDLMPAGFKYVAGSYHVFKNGVDITGSIPEPVYHSPGKWYLGDAVEGNVFELVYTAAIDGSQKAGLYKDLAWAYGCAEGTANCSVTTGILATAASSGTTDSGLLGATNFVGTKVNLNQNQQDTPSVNLSSSQGEVLGASTSLPSTGTPNWLFIISLIFTMFGFLLILAGLYRKRALRFTAKLSGFILAAALFMTLTGGAQASDILNIRLTQPKSPTRSNDLTVSFTTMDLIGGQPITVKCYKKGPSDGSFTQMGADISVIAGGNNGQCPFDSSMMNSNGTYQFYTTADSANGNAVSETISVDYNTSGPGTPSSYGKDKISNCEYKIHFKTADDGKTNKVEIYRSENTSFTADGGTRVSSMNIGPNQDGTYDDIVPDCNKSYYYVVRAFDSAGNGSGLIGDSVTTATTATNASTTGSGTGAIPVANVTLGAGAQEGSVLGISEEKSSSASTEQTGSAGAVLAVETQKVNEGPLLWIFGHKKMALAILALLSLLIFGGIRYARKQRNTSGPTFQ